MASSESDIEMIEIKDKSTELHMDDSPENRLYLFVKWCIIQFSIRVALAKEGKVCHDEIIMMNYGLSKMTVKSGIGAGIGAGCQITLGMAIPGVGAAAGIDISVKNGG